MRITKRHLFFWGGIAVFLLGIRLTLFIQDGGNLRAFHPGSRLGLYEPSIEAVSTEFLRRSPELRATYEEFEDCIWDYCDMGNPKRLAVILAKRDRIIKRDWPQVFDYLVVEGDWLGRSRPPTEAELDARNARLLFQKALHEYGADTIRNHCVPIIKFLIEDGNRKPYPSLDRAQSYRCESPPPRQH